VKLPSARGPLTAALTSVLAGGGGRVARASGGVRDDLDRPEPPVRQRTAPAGRGRGRDAFYDEHVEADAVHEQVAAHDMCGVFCATEPERAADVLFGARCALALDAMWATGVLAAWERGESSLLGFA
jgi:hypothetical protein